MKNGERFIFNNLGKIKIEPSMFLPGFKKKPILGILRGGKAELIEPLVETVISAGLVALEITMNTPGAAELIRKARRVGGRRLILGAGTVLTQQDLKSALGSGASFIVLPVLVREVVEYCVKNRIPVFPGALTPQEIYQAHISGATMVKVFPAKFYGPEYFREIKGPFNKIELLACGGVTAENLKNYFASGASAVTFGSSIFRKDWLAAKDFKAIGQAVKNFIHAWECLDKKD
jgi:2-dehydro-3-deoxyphosphogluconate aldolase/(4S)-4-hydroxy-2-oxoglutarate aldolase